MDLIELLENAKGFEWDKGNINKNLAKHKTNARESEEIFFNKPLIIFKDKRHSKKEKRFGVFGKTKNGRLLTIIFTFRKNKIRIISARNQSKKERRQYEKD